MVLALLNRCYDTFSENEQYVCRYLAGHLPQCADLSIEDFSRSCHVSKSMLVRFAKKLGFSGYSELRAQIRIELAENAVSADGLLEHVTGSYNKMLDDLSKKDLSRFFALLDSARRVFLFGSGASQTRVCSEMKRMFLPVREMLLFQGHDSCQPLCRMAQPEDLVILVSLSGESEPVVTLADTLRTKGVPTVSITRLQSNPLASLCTENLYINSTRMMVAPDTQYETATPYFILIEFLYLCYCGHLARKE